MCGPLVCSPRDPATGSFSWQSCQRHTSMTSTVLHSSARPAAAWEYLTAFGLWKPKRYNPLFLKHISWCDPHSLEIKPGDAPCSFTRAATYGQNNRPWPRSSPCLRKHVGPEQSVQQIAFSLGKLDHSLATRQGQQNGGLNDYSTHRCHPTGCNHQSGPYPQHTLSGLYRTADRQDQTPAKALRRTALCHAGGRQGVTLSSQPVCDRRAD